MAKALLAGIVTLVCGVIGLVIGYDLLNGFPEFGSIVSVVVMGTFIIYFNEKQHG